MCVQLNTQEDVNDLKEEVEAECSQFGKVAAVMLSLPTVRTPDRCCSVCGDCRAVVHCAVAPHSVLAMRLGRYITLSLRLACRAARSLVWCT